MVFGAHIGMHYYRPGQMHAKTAHLHSTAKNDCKFYTYRNLVCWRNTTAISLRVCWIATVRKFNLLYGIILTSPGQYADHM